MCILQLQEVLQFTLNGHRSGKQYDGYEYQECNRTNDSYRKHRPFKYQHDALSDRAHAHSIT